MEYKLICGAEIHVELKTKSKMFCGCKNDPFGAAKPNIYTCPVCLGLPGGLPVPNKKAVEDTILLGLALHCEIPDRAHFDRKHYFYPDLPKGYQISQLGEPFCIGGYVDTSFGQVRLNHIHLEEDAAKMHHDTISVGVGLAPTRVSLIDYNRSSVPLVEIVSEPDIKSPEQAKEFLKNVRDIVRSLGISDCDMEKGSMRLEANISLSPDGNLPNYKVEVKNINSFRFYANAMEYEYKRQSEILDKGEIPVQETRGYRSATKSTSSQRGKEGAADYRYMPDGDIPPIEVSREWVEQIKSRLPKLPESIIADLISSGVPESAAKIIVNNEVYLTFVKELVQLEPTMVKAAANDLVNKKISSDTTANDYVKAKKSQAGSKITDEAILLPIIEKLIADNPALVAQFKSGQTGVLGFFVGNVMKATAGKADPVVTNKLVTKLLS